ncbi:MAG: hypothetical protein JWO95_1460, partial [Verrucomicrobiales bacterium]|nr:hypothetical protein [Verrucomicrobiales bacterium]
TPFQRLVQRRELTPQTRHGLKTQHQHLNPVQLKKNIEQDLKLIFTALGNLNREATNPNRVTLPVSFCYEATRNSGIIFLEPVFNL